MNQRTENRIKSENLDLEFKKILCIIREHIPFINSNAYLMQCRVWLEKLSHPNVNKLLRNLYLVELCGQIQKNKLLPPFNEAPPSGSLKSVTKVLMNRKSCRFLFPELQHRKIKLPDLQNALITNIQEIDAIIKDFPAGNILLCPHNTETWDSEELLQSDTELHTASEPIQKIKYKHSLKRMGNQKMSTNKLNYEVIDKLGSSNFDCGEPTTNAQNKNESNETKTCITNESKEVVTEKDDGSWSDLTDVSSGIELVSQREETELSSRIIKTNDKAIEYVQNKMLTDTIKSERFTDSMFEDPMLTCYDEESNFKSPKETNYISADWKNTIDALQLRLSEMTQQNNELKAVIQKLQTQMEENENKNKEETDQTIKRLENLQYGQIARLKEINADKILHLEKSFQTNVEKLENDYQERIHKVTASYEQKISEIGKQNEDVTGKRDIEICKLTEVIQQQCTRITNDISTLQNQVSGCTCDKKLLLLKKCVSKMDKLFQKSEKEYLKQIDRLRQELDIKNTALQIQLKMQKAELIAETSSERQEEFDRILNSLEVKYIKMLEMHENQIMEMKKQDDEKIQTLKELLTKHGIPYDEHDV